MRFLNGIALVDPGNLRPGTNFSDYGVISNDAGRYKSFFLRPSLESNTPFGGRTNCVYLYCFRSSASPYVAQPFAFINLVLSTSHLFDHYRPR